MNLNLEQTTSAIDYLNLASTFKGRDVIEIEDFPRKDLELIMNTAQDIKRGPSGYRKSLEGKYVGLLFFEPSTRTFGSFSNATHRLGGITEEIRDPKCSSLEKGESLVDTIKMFENWVDCIVMRHPKDGAAKYVSGVTDIPVINAGDGKNQHPTQAMLDIFTIRENYGRINGLTIGMLGDLRYGRTIPSLCGALANYDVKIYFIAIPELQVRNDLLERLKARGIACKQVFDNPQKIISELDVLYVTRVQKERFSDPADYERIKGPYVVNEEFLRNAKPSLRVMHPLPRVDELSYDVDSTPHALYFEQAKNGLFTRMALLHLILGNSRNG